MIFDRVIIGCDQLGDSDWGESKLKSTMEAINYAAESGFRKFDTADVYGLGASEIRLGCLLFNQRKDFEITTKIGVKWKVSSDSIRAETNHEDDPKYLDIALQKSLSRLKGLYLNRVLLHWPKTSKGLEKALETIKTFKLKGHIKEYGFCNFDNEITDFLSKNGSNHEITYQTEFNLLLNKERFINKISNLVNKVMVYGIFAQGILAWSGYKFKNQQYSDRRERLNIYNYKNKYLINQTLLEIGQIANDYKVENSTLILYSTLKVLNKADVIIGVRSRSHIDSILKIESLKINDSDLKHLIKLLKNLGEKLNITNSNI
tara:strand:+ start:29194 stop:30147 length:954 start_codon:yes stop_codon:yes gene_type:complete